MIRDDFDFRDTWFNRIGTPLSYIALVIILLGIIYAGIANNLIKE